jgi:hypothetical protein
MGCTGWGVQFSFLLFLSLAGAGFAGFGTLGGGLVVSGSFGELGLGIG